MLEIKKLRKVYESGDEALKGVSVNIEGNEVVAMIGPSGAGKSTFVRCINRLVEPTSGEIWLDNNELTDLSGEELRKSRRDIGMVFQEYALVERLTVMENVLSGRLGYISNWKAFRRDFPQEEIQFAYQTLERVGMDGHENQRVDELSGGQRQRVGIARAVLQQPKLILADEPTSSLDPETSHTVMDLLTEIAEEEDIPVVVNIHEVPLAERYADRILGLTEGGLVFDGTPAELGEKMKNKIYRDEEPVESLAATADSSNYNGESTDALEKEVTE